MKLKELFQIPGHGRTKAGDPKTYDREHKVPVIRCSICTGEKTAGFRDTESGHFEEVMLIRTETDLDEFRQRYGIEGKIEKIY